MFQVPAQCPQEVKVAVAILVMDRLLKQMVTIAMGMTLTPVPGVPLLLQPRPQHLGARQTLQKPGGASANIWMGPGGKLPTRVQSYHSQGIVSLQIKKEEMWDLTDSLAELYEVSQKFEVSVANSVSSTLQLQGGRRGAQTSPRHNPKEADIREWLTKDNSNGFIRVYQSNTSNSSASQLVPCTLSTSAHKICLVLGISINALHIQLNGDIIRRLDPYEHPLVLQNEYLAGLGYTDLKRIQDEGVRANLGYLVKFFSGKFACLFVYFLYIYTCNVGPFLCLFVYQIDSFAADPLT